MQQPNSRPSASPWPIRSPKSASTGRTNPMPSTRQCGRKSARPSSGSSNAPGSPRCHPQRRRQELLCRHRPRHAGRRAAAHCPCRRCAQPRSPAPPDSRPAGLPEQPRTLRASRSSPPSRGPASAARSTSSPAATCATRSADATFSIKEIDIGMVADVGTLQRLPRLIGEGQARELAYTGRTLNGLEAEKLGLANRLFATPAELEAGVRQIARSIAAQNRRSPFAAPRKCSITVAIIQLPTGSTSSPPGTPPAALRRPEGMHAGTNGKTGAAVCRLNWQEAKARGGPFSQFLGAGIRTLDAFRHAGFQDRCIRPLCHTPLWLVTFYEARMITSPPCEAGVETSRPLRET